MKAMKTALPLNLVKEHAVQRFVLKVVMTLLMWAGTGTAGEIVQPEVVFTTRFLNLTSGVHPVAVAVEGPVAAVKLLLDDSLVMVIRGKPWQGTCNFGEHLKPHKLTAVALDGDGHELARTSQLVNLPRPAAEASILLRHDKTSLPRHASIVWQGAFEQKVTAARITLDGQELIADDLSDITLPPYAADEIHILSAELELKGKVTTRAQVAFGGAIGGDAQTELTAVPIVLDDPALEISAAGMSGWFIAHGKPLQVVAVERSNANLVVIHDKYAAEALRRTAADELEGRVDFVKRFKDDESAATRFDRIRLIHPEPRKQGASSGTLHTFPIQPSYQLTRDSLRWFLCGKKRDRPRAELEQRLSDAVAVAGVRCVAKSSRRAVLLVVDKSPEDHSIHTAASVRTYLQSIHVPLFVWSTDEQQLSTRWGEADYFTCDQRYAEVAIKLYNQLSRQRIVWLNGAHLPDRIELSEQAVGIHLLSTEPKSGRADEPGRPRAQ